ncbi:LOW QUALITY PROTEIN: transmembrane and coiled-coil domains protein 2-like [Limulus polyphemus]|uniref:LOW QUALITY PROTEIN: transmembrane and coiled-coil domains protein 2-like n=1 Tax=Limulus polyphemus TaxID=6850 RepID=A0ABM1SKT0_LIMPO|nr:LOW QUALITY PROTEIN: transmembrane and coiled-coil domains protein 2-like [Limulus polyphemus]
MMKRKKSPLLLRKGGSSSDSSGTPKQSTPPTSTSSLVSGASQQYLTPSSVTLTSTPLSHTSSVAGSLRGNSQFYTSLGDDSTVTDDVSDIQDSANTINVTYGPPVPNGSMDTQSTPTVQGGSTGSADEPDGNSSNNPLDALRTKQAIENLHKKVARTKDLIKLEQTARDENVNEYLKLAASADKQQLQRIKNVFEKKNQKSAQTVAHLQKKLENYVKRGRDLETHGLPASHWQAKGMLRDMGQGISGVVGNIKGGLSGLSAVTHTAAETVMSKPREFAHLIKNRFGSADNINTLGKISDERVGEGEKHLHGSETFTPSTKYASEDESSSITSGSAGQLLSSGFGTTPQHLHSSEVPFSPPNVVDVEPMLQELQARREECQHLADEIETLKVQLQQECSFFTQALLEERYRYERLEEQMNDLIELHQNEIENLKQGISDMEEKVQYQSEERLRDVHEVLESCQTRISRMEHQQHQHFQQLVNLDSLENSNARAMVLKLINVLLTVLQVVLLLVATLGNILMPFLKTRFRILTTILLIVVVAMMVRGWRDVINWVQQHFIT